MSARPSAHLVVALRAEARPLIEYFSRRQEMAIHGFEHWRGDDDVDLVVSGIGRSAAATAVGWLAGSLRNRDPTGVRESGLRPGVWLNVGIVGHGARPVGEALLAHKVIERGGPGAWYPPLTFEPPCATDTVETVARPELAYPHQHAYDMEAAGFVAAARRFTTAEAVHCLKVVSDGPDASIAAIDRQHVRRSIASVCPLVETVLERLRDLIAPVAALADEPAEFGDMLGRWHFSASDRRQLRHLLRRRQTICPDRGLPQTLDTLSRGRQVNAEIERWLDGAA